MVAAHGETINQPPVSISEFFHDTVQRLIHDNLDFVLSRTLGDQRNVEVLHLIDANLQPSTPLNYHLVYESFDTTRQIKTCGILIANPWTRPRVPGQPRSEMKSESRHYFDGGEELVVREDIRRGTTKYEFLQGATIFPGDATNPQDERALLDLHQDLYRVRWGDRIRPVNIAFNQFARRSTPKI